VPDLKLIGLDLSLTSTGVSINGKTSIISTKTKGPERLSYINKTVLQTCLDDKIDCAIIEGYSFASRNSQAHSIGELGGCIRMTFWECGIAYVEVPPTSRAKFATGKGNAGKTEVISAISSKTGLIFSGAGADDECDAWILEQMGLAYLGKSSYDWTSVQLSSLEKIDWSPLDNKRSVSAT
jgi:Holliday junction resolvasome RuvABC endonuclease subunit